MDSPVGFLLVDKPINWTSNDLVQYLKKKIPRKTKIGHAGTLDPLATGLMIIGIGRPATKQFDQLLKKDKTYITEIDLSAYSETDDGEGPFDPMDLSDVKFPTESEIQKVIQEHFLGQITQVPSKYSAIKINGKRAYDLARKGHEVKMPERKVLIHALEILDYQFPILKIKVECSSGTYIRNLGRDIGTKLGFRGYLKSLRRIQIDKYVIENAYQLEEIEKWDSIPAENLFMI